MNWSSSAQAFLECQTWFPIENGINPVVIVRFFGWWKKTFLIFCFKISNLIGDFIKILYPIKNISVFFLNCGFSLILLPKWITSANVIRNKSKG